MARSGAFSEGSTTSIDSVDLIAAIGAWSAGQGTLQRRLATAIRGAIERGQLPPGHQLPAERSMAQSLGIGRSTVVASLERLQDQGWVVRRRGSGTYVSRPLGSADWGRLAGVLLTPSVAFKERATSPRIRSASEPIEFTAAALPGPQGLQEIATLATGDLSRHSASPGYSVLGLESLREVIASHLTGHGLPSTAAQVLVTSGAQQALALAAALLVQAGDTVLLENPTWTGAIDAYRVRGGQIIPVPIDDAGIRVDECKRLAIASHRPPRVIHLSPSVNNPTGIMTSDDRRRSLASLADDFGIPVVEDAALAELARGSVPPPVARYVQSAVVITIGSISKLCWGGVRIGWIRAPAPVIARLAELKLVFDHGTSIPSQLFALRLFEALPDIRRQRRVQVSERLEIAARELSTRLPSWQWREPDGGLTLWVRIPHGDALEFAQIARAHEVIIVPGPVSSPNRSFTGFFRLPYVHEPTLLREGIRRLAAAWDEYDDRTRTRARPA